LRPGRRAGLLLGWALLSVQDGLTGEALEIFQTATLFVAAGLITQMVLWMRKHGRQMKARLHADLAAAANAPATSASPSSPRWRWPAKGPKR
jgi:high-affinity iron transporter